MYVKLIYPSHDFYNKRVISENGGRRRRTLFPPVNIALLAALTPLKYRLEVVDENVEVDSINTEDLPDVVGISAMTGTAPRMYELADEYRMLGVKVILGGSHATAMPGEALKHADAVVIGEADEIWADILNDFEKGTYKRIYKQKNYSSLKGLPILRYDLFQEGSYYMPRTFQTSRGCPYNCSFCSVTSTFGRRYRHRPIEDVIREIKETPGPNLVAFTDDNIMADRRRAKELFKALKELKIIWASQASINSARDTELLRLAQESGCRALFIGIESISEETLKEANKSGVNRPKDYGKLIENFRRYGVRLLGSFVFGFDTEERDVFYKTVRFAVNSKLDLAQFSVLTPFPGTSIYDRFKEEGRLMDIGWEHFYQGEVCFYPMRMSPQELQRGQRYAWRKFYTTSNTLKRIIRYGKYTPIYWLVNYIFSQINLSDVPPLVNVVKKAWKMVDKTVRLRA
ncbi:MAG: B12-binding domain-containing radical SAM protein [Candidatus Coatesbacteria bacterium]|nr:MAG: B12-binding domain-containing radical SAM protein [Candidatus Coatesbacteria bacterium]